MSILRGGAGHRWKFFRIGGVDQVDLRTGADIVNLENLDQKLWVALACPVDHLEFDRRTLELLDTDKDGRIRAPEIIEVTRWVKEVFKNPDDLVAGGEAVSLTSINESTPAGAALIESARSVLGTLGKADAAEISLTDVSDTAKIFAATDFNGDGIVPASSAGDEKLRQVIEQIIATHGAAADRSGKPGIDLAKTDAFLAGAAALVEWHDRGAKDPAVLPLGDGTAKAAASLQAVRGKVDDYFTRCRLAEFDARYQAVLSGAEADFAPAAAKELSGSSEEIAKLPLARIQPKRPLPLREGLNPAWAGAIAAFRESAVVPLAGNKAELDEGDWKKIKDALAPFEAWSRAKPQASVESLGIPRLREILALNVRPKLASLIEKDAAFSAAANQITTIEKLVRVKRDLYRLLNNFVSFADFYARRGAVFQAGTLYLDSRSCDLCVHVADAGKHAALAGLSKAYLAYCDCTRPGEKRTIAAAFTAGDSDHLMAGRNGVFYDRQGRDWDATITKVIENPISIRQAFLSPYKKFIRMIEEQVAKRAAAADAAAQANLGEAAAKTAELKGGEVAKLAPKKVDVGTVAAIGVALGSVGTFLALIFAKFLDLGYWAPMAVVAIILLISGPSMLIAYLKLRQRNIGPILDANGWAVNGRMKINVPFGGALSKNAHLPPGAERQLTDPFAEKKSGRKVVIFLLIVLAGLFVAWRLHAFDRFLPPRFQPAPASAPASPPPAASPAPAPAP